MFECLRWLSFLLVMIRDSGNSIVLTRADLDQVIKTSILWQLTTSFLHQPLHCSLLPGLVDHLNIGGHKSISWQCDIGVPNESIKYLYRRNRWNYFNMICIKGWWNENSSLKAPCLLWRLWAQAQADWRQWVC